MNLDSPDEVWLLRLEVQTRLLEAAGASDGGRIFTIADDMDQNFALLYFVIDYVLLQVRAARD